MDLQLQRGLDEAQDLFSFFSAPLNISSRIYARTASFCSERSGHFDGFDQGISFFLPNMTWIQPVGWVHAMISDTWAEIVLAADYTALPASMPFIAQLTADRSTFVLRAVNMANVTQQVSVQLTGGAFSFVPGSDGSVSVLTGSDPQGDNPPSDPLSISPTWTQATVFAANSVSLDLPPYSFVVGTFPVQPSA